jgi:hypothetical protein
VASAPPRFRVVEIECYEWPYALRLPFRFGAATITAGRQALLRARIRLADGRGAWGWAAEALAAKWFDKDANLSDEENVDQLRRSLELAAEAYLAQPAQTAFAHFAESYAPHTAACATIDLNPLVAGFGPALIDRAAVDALCRCCDVSFFAAAFANLFGLAPHPIAPDLADFDFDGFLATWRAPDGIALRHTVDLADAVTLADVAPGDRVADGLPQTLEEVIARYRPGYFKLKISGDVDRDVARLASIASVLDRAPAPYFATLDGNEQYRDVEPMLALWRRLEAAPALARLCRAILFIEQPIARSAALALPIAPLAHHRPVIIDESDGTLEAFPRARALGYDGVSSKGCKGLYKSLINLARAERWNAAEGRRRYFLTGEDLTTLAGVSVQQDLALASLLGLTHVERNGHHYVDGFTGRSQAEARAFLSAHPDLYQDDGGRVRMRIDDGTIALRSLQCTGFAHGAEPDPSSLGPMPASAWRGAHRRRGDGARNDG